MAIIIFFQIRHSWKVKKDLEKIKNWRSHGFLFLDIFF
jgi:hypothetical protein